MFQEICIAAERASDNDPNVQDMNNWGANLFSKCHLNSVQQQQKWKPTTEGLDRRNRVKQMVNLHCL